MSAAFWNDVSRLGAGMLVVSIVVLGIHLAKGRRFFGPLMCCGLALFFFLLPKFAIAWGW